MSETKISDWKIPFALEAFSNSDNLTLQLTQQQLKESFWRSSLNGKSIKWAIPSEISITPYYRTLIRSIYLRGAGFSFLFALMAGLLIWAGYMPMGWGLAVIIISAILLLAFLKELTG